MHQNLFIDFCFLSIGWFEFCILHNLFSFQENQCVCLFVQKATFNNNGILLGNYYYFFFWTTVLGNYINSKIYYRVHRHRKRKRFNTWKKTKNTVTLRLFYSYQKVPLLDPKPLLKLPKSSKERKKLLHVSQYICFALTYRLRNLNFSKKWF